jgi:NAD(P) transhydrogenase subunit alpha
LGGIFFSDAEYVKAGASVETDRQRVLSVADIVLAVRDLRAGDVLKPGAIELAKLLRRVPRTSVAQKMDVASSQANLAGYAAVILAAERLSRVLPMMTTPAGTLSAARVFVVGAGVAGLQAIATAHRLGARVEAFDNRTEVEEQIRSLGAKFVGKEHVEAHCKTADVLITTARGAGKIISAANLKPGSVAVDLAGNIDGEGSGVTLIRDENLAAKLSLDASQMYSANATRFIEHFWDRDAKKFDLEKANAWCR